MKFLYKLKHHVDAAPIISAYSLRRRKFVSFLDNFCDWISEPRVQVCREQHWERPLCIDVVPIEIRRVPQLFQFCHAVYDDVIAQLVVAAVRAANFSQHTNFLQRVYFHLLSPKQTEVRYSMVFLKSQITFAMRSAAMSAACCSIA